MNKQFLFYMVVVVMMVVVAISNDGPSLEECDEIGTSQVSVSMFGEPDVLDYQLSAGLVRIDFEREELLEIDNLTLGSTWANSQNQKTLQVELRFVLGGFFVL